MAPATRQRPSFAVGADADELASGSEGSAPAGEKDRKGGEKPASAADEQPRIGQRLTIVSTRAGPSRTDRWRDSLPSYMGWAKPHLFSWASWRPVVRASIAAWICLLLLLIDTTREAMGVAPYLLLIISFIAPSVGLLSPVIAYVEQTIFMCSLVAGVIAWGSFWIWIAWLARGSARVDQATFTAEATRRAIAGGARTAAEIAYAIQDQTFNGVYLECGSQSPSRLTCAAFAARSSSALRLQSARADC